MFFIIKVLVSALIIAGASTLARYNKLLATLLISLPLTSLLSFIWIYADIKDTAILSKMSMDIFWLVLVSLIFFVVFSFLLNKQFSFWAAITLATVALIVCYSGFVLLKSYFF